MQKLIQALPQRQPDDTVVKACVSMVFACEHEEWFLLFIKRVFNDRDPWSGHYAFPGGRLEDGESTESCAKRECFEEVRLDLSSARHWGQGDDFVAPDSSNWAIRPHVFSIERRVDLVNDPAEVAASYWLSMKDLLKKDHLVEKKFATMKGERLLPCISFDDHTIWGISYAILMKLLNRWQNIEYLPGKSFQYPYSS